MYLVDVSLQACHIVLAVNDDAHNYFTVSCNATGSMNVFSTRGELCTMDIILPRHR